MLHVKPQLQEKLAQVDSDLSAEENTHYRQITSSNTIPSPALAFSPDGKRLASGSLDRTIKVWGERMRNQPTPAAQP